MASRRAAWALAVAALSLGTPAGQAGWLVGGFDAAHTGAVSEAGPANDDVAWTIRLPGSKGASGAPLILDGQLYVLTMNGEASGWGTGLTTNGLWRIDLARAEPVLLLPFGEAPVSFASDGARIFVTFKSHLAAYALEGGDELWRVTLPQRPRIHLSTFCSDPTPSEGVVYVACTQRGGPLPSPTGGVVPQYMLLAFATRAESGEVLWWWFKNVTTEAQPAGPALIEGAPLDASTDAESFVYGASLIGRHFLVSVKNLPGRGGLVTRSMWSLDAVDGKYEWSMNTTFQPATYWSRVNPRDPGFTRWATGTPSAVYFKLDDLLAVNPNNVQELWRLPLGAEDTDGTADGGSGIAFAGNAVFVTSSQTLYRIEAATHSLAWLTNLDPDLLENFGNTGLIVADGVVYARTVRDGETTANPLYAFDVLTGALRWRHDFSDDIFDTGPIHFEFSLAEGIIAAAGINGNVTVLGRTAASLVPELNVSDEYPAPRQEVSVDLSRTRPGLQGAATRFAADWGEGESTAWQPGPLLTHRYNRTGDVSATFRVGNAAGQTSSETLTFHVGGTPPPPAEPLRPAEAPVVVPSEAPLLGLPLLLLAGVVAVGAAGLWAAASRRSREDEGLRERLHEHQRAAYRAALQSALQGGAPTPRERAMLARLRRELGVSEREHALAEQAFLGAFASRGAGAGLAPGKLFLGRYRVRRKLGEGGAGATYLCQDEQVRRQVVLKAIRSPARAKGGLDTVLREARAIAAIEHPHVVTLHDVEQVGEEAFIVMEHLAGGSLAARLQRQPLPPEEFRRVARGLLLALDAVHRAGLVHRDVKPSNVLLTATGEAKLADFGVAHLPGFETTAPTAADGSSAVGSVPYMSPEQAKGHRLGPHSDLFSAAATLYEAWTGRGYLSPRPGESAFELQLRAASRGAFDLHVDGAPSLRAWFARALDPRPEDRFTSAAAMWDALERALS